MTGPAETWVFDPAAMERELRRDPENALRELALAVRRGDVTVRLRSLNGVGSNDPERVHFHLSLELGVVVVTRKAIGEPGVMDPVAPLYHAERMRNMLEGHGMGVGVRR